MQNQIINIKRRCRHIVHTYLEEPARCAQADGSGRELLYVLYVLKSGKKRTDGLIEYQVSDRAGACALYTTTRPGASRGQYSGKHIVDSMNKVRGGKTEMGVPRDFMMENVSIGFHF